MQLRTNKKQKVLDLDIGYEPQSSHNNKKTQNSKTQSEKEHHTSEDVN
jgi:hypothetical protein